MKLFTTSFIVVFLSFVGYSQKLALAKINKDIGFIDESGEFAILPQYQKALDFSEDLAGVLIDGKWGFIDRKGDIVISPKFDRVKSFNNDIAVALIDKRWFYIDKEGNEITNFPQTDKYYDFSEERAPIKNGESVGLIDNKGNIIVKPMYQEIKSVENGHARVKRNNQWGVIDKNGKIIVEPEFNQIVNTYKNATIALRSSNWGVVIDNEFKIIEGVEKIWGFNDEGIAYAKKGGLLGFINSEGEWIISPQFDKVRAFSNGFAPAFANGGWGYINLEGNWIIRPKYIDAEVFSEDGLAPVKEKKLWGFIDKNDNLEIPFNYDITAGFFQTSQKGFIDGYARVKTKKGWAFIDKSNQVLGNKWFKNLELFK